MPESAPEPSNRIGDGTDRPNLRLTLGPSKRLTHALEYKAVYAAKMRKSAAGVSVSSRPNTLNRHRLGLAISRAVGTAASRTRFKRLIREAFRLHQRELATLPDGACFDWVVSLRAGSGSKDADGPRSRDEMARVLLALAQESSAAWSRRVRRGEGP